MKEIHKSTTVGVLFLLIAVPLLWYDFRLSMSLLCLGGYFAAIKEVSKYTTWYQFATVFMAALLLGLSIEYPYTHLPYITIVVFFAACASIVRIVFFNTFSYTRYPWFEPAALILSVIIWVVGNIIFKADWRPWVLPSPVIAFAGVLSYGILKDEKQLLAATKGGYKVQIGKEAPDFSLPDQDNELVNLAQFKGRHLLLIFVRGDWCPGCHMMLRTYEKNREKFKEKNILVMAIGPDPVGVNREMVKKLDLEFKVLSDEGQRTAMVYGVQLSEYDNDFAQKYEAGIPLPASFLVDKNAVVRYVSRPDRVGEFLNPALIFPIIETLN